jgi:hypothetical protein
VVRRLEWHEDQPAETDRMMKDARHLSFVW